MGLYCDCIKKNVEVHRLVAMAFIPNKCAKPEVNHKDGVRNHNCVSNLEWATRSENQTEISWLLADIMAFQTTQ